MLFRSVNIPPQIEETTERGAKIRKIKEKGTLHSLSLLEGLPVHGALFDMSGFRMPQVKKVPTAKQYSQNMMSQGMLQQLTGQIMTLGQMFQGLMGNKGGGGGGGGLGGGTGAGGGTGGGTGGTGNTTNTTFNTAATTSNTAMQRITSALDPRMAAAVNSMSLLVQGLETGSEIGRAHV